MKSPRLCHSERSAKHEVEESWHHRQCVDPSTPPRLRSGSLRMTGNRMILREGQDPPLQGMRSPKALSWGEGGRAQARSGVGRYCAPPQSPAVTAPPRRSLLRRGFYGRVKTLPYIMIHYWKRIATAVCALHRNDVGIGITGNKKREGQDPPLLFWLSTGFPCIYAILFYILFSADILPECDTRHRRCALPRSGGFSF